MPSLLVELMDGRHKYIGYIFLFYNLFFFYTCGGSVKMVTEPAEPDKCSFHGHPLYMCILPRQDYTMHP